MNPRNTIHVDPSDPLVRAVARFVEALDHAYPAGPADLPKVGLAFHAHEANMPTVLDDDGPSAA